MSWEPLVSALRPPALLQDAPPSTNNLHRVTDWLAEEGNSQRHSRRRCPGPGDKGSLEQQGKLQRLRQALGANLDSAAPERCDGVRGCEPSEPRCFPSQRRGVPPGGRRRRLNRTARVNVTSLSVRTHVSRRETRATCPSPPWEARDRGLSQAFWRLGFHTVKGRPDCPRDYDPAFRQPNFTQKMGSLLSPWNL